MTYAVFTDEGKVSGDFSALSNAEDALHGMLADCEGDEGRHLHTGECCPDHPDQESGSCDECDGES